MQSIYHFIILRLQENLFDELVSRKSLQLLLLTLNRSWFESFGQWLDNSLLRSIAHQIT